jgi:hypothetical protein
MSAIDTLRELLIPPDSPIGTGSAEEWDRLEGRLGTRLPTDYKQFAGAYGAGSINVPHDEFAILNPFAGLRSMRLERMIATQREAHAAIVEIWGAYGDPPEQPDGLIPWGTNSTRGLCFWEPTDADPDRWTVHGEIDDDRMSFPENMTTYLLNVFRGVHDYFIPWVERTEFHLPMRFTAARPRQEALVSLDALQRPGPVINPDLARLGISLEVVTHEELGVGDVFLAVRTSPYVSVELVDGDGEWVPLKHAGFATGSDSWGVYWPSGMEALFASSLVLEKLG